MDLTWKSEQPFSEAFQDRYFADEDGLAESRYVFLEQNQLPSRWQKNDSFVIAELGFGTGLNFLATFKAWNESPGEWLHFISCEKFPLNHDQIERTLTSWPELGPLLRKFLKKYEVFPEGIHRIHFDEDRVSLTLFIGDALESLRNASASVDAWYFDGFSPRKNPEMWGPEIFDEVRRLSKPHASFATYTSAGFIKRNLQALGFHVEKFKGFGRKRDMLRGQLLSKEVAAQTPQRIAPSVRSKIRAAVIGGGLAGTSVALALSRRNIHVHLYEQNSDLALEASGHSAGITLPIISGTKNLIGQLSLRGLSYLQQWLDEWNSKLEFSRSGAIHLAHREDQLHKWKTALDQISGLKPWASLIDPNEATQISGFEIEKPALYFPKAIWMKPSSLCRAQLSKNPSYVETHFSTKITCLDRTQTGWAGFNVQEHKVFEADLVFLTNAHEIQNFSQVSWLPLRKVRGQVIELASNSLLSRLKTVLCFDGYLTPDLGNQRHLLGATYDHQATTPFVSGADTSQLLQNLWAYFPALKNESLKVIEARAAFRSSLPGQEPISGSALSKDGEVLEGLYVLGGLASRGLLYAPLLAEDLVSRIFGEPSLLESSFEKSVSPQRLLRKF